MKQAAARWMRVGMIALGAAMLGAAIYLAIVWSSQPLLWLLLATNATVAGISAIHSRDPSVILTLGVRCRPSFRAGRGLVASSVTSWPLTGRSRTGISRIRTADIARRRHSRPSTRLRA